MPKELFDELTTRSRNLNKKLPVYCRIILEHAMNTQGVYGGKPISSLDDGLNYASTEINIPVLNKKFLEAFKKWAPWGDEYANRTALAILTQHVEINEW